MLNLIRINPYSWQRRIKMRIKFDLLEQQLTGNDFYCVFQDRIYIGVMLFWNRLSGKVEQAFDDFSASYCFSYDDFQVFLQLRIVFGPLKQETAVG